MKKNTKTLIIVFCLILACTLCGCSIKEEPGVKTTPEPESTIEAHNTPAAPEESPAVDAENDKSNGEGETTGPIVAIYVGNYIYDVVLFEEEKVITIDQGDGKVNEVTLTGDAVYMSHSTCDNQDCVQQGEITAENHETRILMDWIICLPNQVTIEFITGDEQ